MNSEFTDKLIQFRRAPGIFILKVTYPEVCAFVSGLDVGVGRQVTSAFEAWLIAKGVEQPELAWPHQVLAQLYPAESLPKLATLR